MKKCNKCGYPSLEDSAKKCRCGAIEDNTLFTCIVPIFILSNIESFLFLMGLILLNIEVDRENTYLYSFLVLYLSQCLIYFIYNKNRIKKSGAKITEFTYFDTKVAFKKKEDYSSRVVDFKQDAPKDSCNNGNTLLKGIVAGVVINEIFDND